MSNGGNQTMKHPKKWIMMLVGLLAAGAVSAQAQTVEITMGGSSAGTGFATQVPPNLFKTHSGGTPIVHYVNGLISCTPTPCDVDPNTSGNQTSITGGKLHVWTGTLDGTKTGVPALDGKAGIIRYAATGSADGIRKVENQTTKVPYGLADAGGFMTFLDHTSGCSAPVNVDLDGDTVTDYQQTTDCTSTFSGPLYLGAADVEGGSFGQSGPLGTVAAKQDQSALENNKVAVVPFKVVLGKGVKKRSDPTNPASPLVPVTHLTRLQIEAIFGSANLMGTSSPAITAKDWRRFDFVPDANGDGTDDGGAAPITLCMRTAGSGTKAAFDQTLMINAGEIVTTNGGQTLYNGSTQDVIDCILGRDDNANGLYTDSGDLLPHPLAIGYLDADALPNDPGAPGYKGDNSVDNDPNTAAFQADTDSFPDLTNTATDGEQAYDYTIRTQAGCGGHPFGYDFIANGIEHCDPRAHLLDGQYAYWVGWNLNRRFDGFSGISSDQDSLMHAFINKAGSVSTIRTLSAGAFWASFSEMCVSKDADKGPHKWKNAGSTPAAPSYCAAGNGQGN
jgi:hypothetical protein